MNMRLLGARNIEEVTPEMVDASSIAHRNIGVTDDKLFSLNYEGLRVREFSKPQPKSKL